MKVFLLALGSFLFGISGGLVFVMLSPVPPRELISPITNRLEFQKRSVIGFLPYWLLEKTQASYDPYVTDLAYFSLTVSEDGTIEKYTNPGEEEPGWTTLKKPAMVQKLFEAKNNHIQLSLVVFSSKQESIDALVSHPVDHANALLADIAPIMREHHFTDLNIDIESVTVASESARQHFTQFLQTIKNGLVVQKLGTLSVDIVVPSLFQPYLTDPIAMGRIADRVMVMTYDFHYPGSFLAGPITPLGGVPFERANDVTTAMMAAMQQIPKEKLILGIPLYGYEWETISSSSGQPVIPHTGQTASDRRVEQLLSTCTNCIQKRDSIADEPHLVVPDGPVFDQVYYTDTVSLENRLRFAKERSLGGIGLWALGYEGEMTLEPLKRYK